MTAQGALSLDSRFFALVKEELEQAPAVSGASLSLCDELRRYRIPNGELPLANDRAPFQTFDDDTILCAARNVLAVGYKVGRLSDAVRSVAGAAVSTRDKVLATIESHIDLTETSKSVTAQLVRLGFEPDDFIKLEPPCYKKHFTLKVHVTDEARQTLQPLKRAVHRASTAAAEFLQSCPALDAFIEEELYTRRHRRSYTSRPFDDGAASTFPVELANYRPRPFPRTEDESQKSGVSLLSRKAADVHIKLLASSGSLGSLLESVAFYSIISEAGNTIYTGQYISIREATKVFQRLDSFLSESGGAKSLVLEVCTDFWRRKSPADQGTVTLAQISPVLVRS